MIVIMKMLAPHKTALMAPPHAGLFVYFIFYFEILQFAPNIYRRYF